MGDHCQAGGSKCCGIDRICEGDVDLPSQLVDIAQEDVAFQHLRNGASDPQR